MKDGTPFSKAFTRLRKEAGFATAYNFFHANGGRKVLQCTFSNYLRIEKGETLPHPRRLPILATLLRLPLRGRERRRLVEAYLESWSESAETAAWLGQALREDGGPEAPPDPSAQALRKAVRESSRPVSMEQYRAIIRDRASYWCYRVLAASRQAHGPGALSRLLGLPEPEVRRGLESLREAGFAKRERDGGYRCPFAGEFHLFPDPAALPPGLAERPLRYNEAMARRKGGLLMVRHCGTRVDLERFEGFLPFFREAVRSAQTYAVSSATERSGLVFVEGRVYKALDF